MAPSDPHAPPPGPRPLAGWTGVAPHPAQPAFPPGHDDGWINVAGVALACFAVLILATGAALAGAAASGLLTWRRTRWWPPVLVGVAGLVVAVAASGGPAVALHHHLTAARELTGPHPHGLADLIGRRLPVWLAWQLPLGLPLGLAGAGLARHRVTHTPAHELSGPAQARRAAEAAAQLRRACRRSADAPATVKDRPVLGGWVTGDLTEWKTGEWCTLPAGVLGLGTVVLGLPGTGKTETLLRLAQAAFTCGFDVHVIDAKGDPATQARFAALAAAAGHSARLFPDEPYDGWRGDPTALRNRLGGVIDYTEPYHQDGARVAVHHATRRQPRNLEALLAGLADTDLDIDPQVRRGTLSRYRSFGAAAGAHLHGAWAFEDAAASYLLLDGVALGDDTPRLARWLLEDFLHYAAARKAPNRKALLVVDEFSALRVAGAAAMLERLRSFRCGVVIAAQSVEGLHDDPAERARLLGAATTVIAHRLADPEAVVTRAGTTKRAERSHQLDATGATGMGSLRIQEAYRVDPNDLRNLDPGVAWIITAGRAAKACITATRRSGAGPAEAAGSSGDDGAAPRSGGPPVRPPAPPEVPAPDRTGVPADGGGAALPSAANGGDRAPTPPGLRHADDVASPSGLHQLALPFWVPSTDEAPATVGPAEPAEPPTGREGGSEPPDERCATESVEVSPPRRVAPWDVD